MSLSKRTSDSRDWPSSDMDPGKKKRTDVTELERVKRAGVAISRGEDVKADMVAMVSTSIRWHSFLEPAPLAIILLGELNLIATQKDFSLKPKDGYKWIKYPDSFRASLCQVSNGGFWAFNEAHKNMEEIKMQSGIVQSHLTTAIRTIIEGKPKQIEAFLPVTLKSIIDIAEDCVVRASSTENKFREVMELIEEMLEASCQAKGIYEKDYNEVEIARKVNAVHAKEAEDMKRHYQKEMEEYKKQLLEAEAEYKKAVKSAPSAGKLFMMTIGEAFVKTVSFIPNFLDHTLGGPKQQQGGRGGQAKQKGNFDTSELCRVLEPLSINVEHIVILTTENRDKITDEEMNEVKTSKHHFEYALKKINNIKPNPFNGEAVKVLKNLLHMADHLIQKYSVTYMQGQDDGNNEKLAKLAVDTRKLFKTLKVKLSSENDFSHHEMCGTLPGTSKQQPSGSPSLVQAVRQDYRFKVEMQMQRLKDARQCYFKSNDKYENQSKELAELLGTMAKLDLEKVHFKEICETLLKGLQALGRVRQQWAKLVRFFQSISSIVKIRMQQPLDMFVKHVEAVSGQIANPGQDGSLKDVLYKQAFSASAFAFMVEHIAGLYTEISDKYIMDDVAAMGTLITYDPEKDKSEIKAKLTELGAKCSETQSAVARMVKEKQREMVASIDTRLQQIEAEFSKALPAPTQEEAEENRAALAETPEVFDDESVDKH